MDEVPSCAPTNYCRPTMWAVTGLPDRSKSVEQWSSVSRTLPQSTLCSPLLLLLFRLLLLLLIVLTPPPLSPPPLPHVNNEFNCAPYDLIIIINFFMLMASWIQSYWFGCHKKVSNQSSETGRVPNITKSVVAPSLEMIKMCFQPKIALCRVKIHLTVFLSFAFHWFPVDPDRWFGTRRPTVEWKMRANTLWENYSKKHTLGELF